LVFSITLGAADEVKLGRVGTATGGELPPLLLPPPPQPDKASTAMLADAVMAARRTDGANDMDGDPLKNQG